MASNTWAGSALTAVRRLKVSATGIRVSSRVFSPASALPRCLMASTLAWKAAAISARLLRSPAFSTLAMVMKKVAISGPDAPPMVESSFMPMRCSTSAGGSGASSSRMASRAAQPRLRLMKWSPSPISRSRDSSSASLLRTASLTAAMASRMNAVLI
uniref:Uncharacterized protein n=2 Tax=prokaryotic environmental samples TaxID=81490 RepID=B3T3L4_9ZZZZ|nr:hypothetical protein ALOHA_HF4000ANIW133B20ctg3g6 [uncultured marine microorganism HF4000_ANIW133B20]ABZ07619.1 hypothetical protein ALOHA_HF4000ANIW137K11ctg5g11 [uncultured marine microorganism HF4000_ANIW137K11]